MKTKGLMFIALFISGAAFAQTATVKQEQQVKTGSNASVNAAVSDQQVTARSAGSSETSISSASGTASGQVSATHQQEGAVIVDPAAVSGTAEAVKSNVESGAKTGANTASHVAKQTVKQGNAAVQQLSGTTATAARSAVHINGAVNNALKIKAAPIKVNTLTTGAVGLGGL